ncbi:hypothetical protein SAMN05444287_0223 [Octadecabacter temperatus]|uniref:Ricin-type beta-trefoil lectin domain protein n=1 Tax=Octadecabacter temperatus TaxID=1458307 RepID=A0A0K0Y2G6_9RHOB|nr:Ricin-type beta-trefoil lectin domain protein [Octadecabacter temperatus]SIN86812.1 hypothetical protein SAMN05444287_0223 [Octadecabacter temperatus]
MSKLWFYFTVSGILSSVQPAVAEAPMLQNSGPVIYLADNLNEPERLGWCIDTVGRGLSNGIQLHSCKPDSEDSRNRDVLFTFDAVSRHIEHAEYSGLCLALNASSAETSLGLIDCETGAREQMFSFDEETGALHPLDQPSQCLTAGQNSRQAGPFQSRSLDVIPCAMSDPLLRTWMIKNED